MHIFTIKYPKQKLKTCGKRSEAEIRTRGRIFRVASEKKREMLFASPFSFHTCARGFEPPTFWSVAKRSIQLS